MKCKYCGKPASLFASYHKDCQLKHEASIKEVEENLTNFLKQENCNYSTFLIDTQKTRADGFISEEKIDCVVSNAITALLTQNFRPWQNIVGFIKSLPSQFGDTIINSPTYASFFQNLLEGCFPAIKTPSDYNDNIPIITQKQREIIDNAKQTDSSTLRKVLNKSLLSYVEQAINNALYDGLIEDDEESYIQQLIEELGLDKTPLLYNSQCYQRLIKALVLQDIMDDKPLTRISFIDVPILLGKTESLVWVFKDTEGYVEKTKRTYVGKSQGVSIRICKGVYYRTGASKGYPVDEQYQSSLGIGNLYVTTKNIIFVGDKTIKIPINKIVSYTEYSDGIELIKDGTTTKPYTFINCDAWFIINAIQLLY